MVLQFNPFQGLVCVFTLLFLRHYIQIPVFYVKNYRAELQYCSSSNTVLLITTYIVFIHVLLPITKLLYFVQWVLQIQLCPFPWAIAWHVSTGDRCLPISELSQASAMLMVHKHGGYIVYNYIHVTGEDHKFVTDWLVSQGLDNINLLYLKLVIQNYKSSMYKYYTIFEISLIYLRFLNLRFLKFTWDWFIWDFFTTPQSLLTCILRDINRGIWWEY